MACVQLVEKVPEVGRGLVPRPGFWMEDCCESCIQDSASGELLTTVEVDGVEIEVCCEHARRFQEHLGLQKPRSPMRGSEEQPV